MDSSSGAGPSWGKRADADPHPHVQYAALPYRSTDGDVQVMLVTSRETRRWIIPKGWPKRGMSPPDAAAEEAFEEAGVVGKVSRRSVGRYVYDKILKTGATVTCSVHVFTLEVMRQHEDWPESHERQVQWYSPDEAARIVQEAELRQIIRRFAKRRRAARRASRSTP